MEFIPPLSCHGGLWLVARAPPFPFSEFVFALQSFSGQSQLLTYCYVVVVIPYYLSLGWVGGKGSWEEGVTRPQALAVPLQNGERRP